MISRSLPLAAALSAALFACLCPLRVPTVRAASHPDASQDFHTSDRCVACHNGLKTSSGEDISIGLQWEASIMANSARDPYWQGSIRRESIDHPEASAALQDECSTCHMPMQHLIDRAKNKKTAVFARLPLTDPHKDNTQAKDGVSCSICHQIEAAGLGTPQTYSGNVAVASVTDRNNRPEYGPFQIDAGHKKVMQSSTAGFVPTEAAHIRDAGLCGSCHTLYTTARGPGGKAIGVLPEQMPYLEWLHSDFPNRYTCQGCHMPEVQGAVAVTAVFGQPREGMHRHVFVGGNFLMEHMLNAHRDELAVKALPAELVAATNRTEQFLRTQSAKLSINGTHSNTDGLDFVVSVENLTGHKLPTAYPSRRAWLHVLVQDAHGHKVFESGALNPDGSIVGNDNDADPLRFEPHYTEITNPQQVEIYESILKDSENHVTTGLLSAIGYLKDNRVLPTGFDKATAVHDIAVVGAAAGDPNFTGGSSRVRYAIKAAPSAGTLPYRGGALVSAGRLSLGAQPRTLQGSRAATLCQLLRRAVRAIGAGHRQSRDNVLEHP